MDIYIAQINFPEWDKELFLYLNNKHTVWLDPIMYALSTYICWILICTFIIFFLIYNSKKQGLQTSLFLLLGIGINSLVSNIVKLFIMRPRPGNDESIQNIIRQLEVVGNDYSFFSAHSSNSICLALFTALYFRDKWYSIIIFAWAFTVAYSRIYVGKHYPLDVMCGICFGFFSGWLAYWLYKIYCKKHNSIPFKH